MKPMVIGSSIGLDRFATWNEIICAISICDHSASALDSDCVDLGVPDSELSDTARDFSEDDMWLAIASEMPASKIN